MVRSSRSLPYLLLLPGILLSVAILYPFLTGAYWSFTRYDLGSGAPPSFNGIANYVRLLTNGLGLHAILITFVYAALAVAVETILGFGVALLLLKEGPLTSVFRALVVLPLLMPPVVATIMWKVMMTPNGVLNYLLQQVGLPPFGWLGTTATALPSTVLIDAWIYTPFVILILLAGLQSIPDDVREAARVDGANWWWEQSHIIIPLLRPFFVIIVVFRGIDALKSFDIIYTSTQGGPINATMNLHVQAYFTGIRSLNIGAAMAFLVILWAFCYALAFGLLRLRRGRPA
ncbi:MAG: sugar ABC transporter permease [Roseiflexaceae bacterium]|nr:sugar ABC transporter permease [Roseiflexaceae bacterium]